MDWKWEEKGENERNKKKRLMEKKLEENGGKMRK